MTDVLHDDTSGIIRRLHAADRSLLADALHELAEHGESVLGMENLVSNLHEYDTPLDRETVALIGRVHTALALPAEDIEALHTTEAPHV